MKQFLGESMDKLIFMKKMNEAWSGHCQQIIMVIILTLIFTYTSIVISDSTPWSLKNS